MDMRVPTAPCAVVAVDLRHLGTATCRAALLWIRGGPQLLAQGARSISRRLSDILRRSAGASRSATKRKQAARCVASGVDLRNVSDRSPPLATWQHVRVRVPPRAPLRFSPAAWLALELPSSDVRGTRGTRLASSGGMNRSVAGIALA